MITRLGVLGGMFDPVHNGHIEAARFALKTLDLDSLQLIPCHIPNHRVAASARSADRLAMLELAIADEPGLVLNRMEIERVAVSYTTHTLTTLAADYPGASLVFVLGMDAFNSIPQWHEWRSLFNLCHFFVLARNGETVLPATADAVLLERRQVHSVSELFALRSGKIWIADDFSNDLSSTRVRTAIRQHMDLSTMLNPKVIEYINQHLLYR